MGDKSRDEDPEFLAYLAAETELKQHADEPRSQLLSVYIQPFTLVRLQRYRQELGDIRSVDEIVNDVLKGWLYSEGE